MNKSLVCLLFLSMVASLHAIPRFAKIFGEGMVLQQGKDVTIWGFSSPNESISIAFAGQTVATQADTKGRWRVTLAKLMASNEPFPLTLSSESSTIALTNVWVGEVWILAGQSNMKFPLCNTIGWEGAQKRAENGELSRLHFFKTNLEVQSESPVEDLTNGAWLDVSDEESFGCFSATGYHFAEALLPQLEVPIGLVSIPRGGTQMFQWVDAEGVASDERFGICFRESLKKNKILSGDWNAKAAPLAGLAVRGVLWYQGETDSWNPYPAENFGPMFEVVIKCWRKSWREPELPFVVAQLPSMDAPQWPKTRAAQEAVAMRVPEVSLANIIDTGWEKDVHPRDKTVVGPRLANVALKNVYGRLGVPVAPRRQQIVFEPGHATVAFDLPIIGRGEYAGGFELKQNGVWTAATKALVISTNKVDVLAADPKMMVQGIRYLVEGWAKPHVWLYGEDGTPAFAFEESASDFKGE